MAEIKVDDNVDITDVVCPVTFVKAKVALEELDDGKTDSPLITGSLGLFTASSPPADEEPNLNLRKKKKKKKQLNL